MSLRSTICLSVFLPVSQPFSFVSVLLSLSQYCYLCLRIVLPISVLLYLSHSYSLCLSLSLCVSVLLFVSQSYAVCLSITISVISYSFSQLLCSFSLSLCLSLILSVSALSALFLVLSISLSLSLDRPEKIDSSYFCNMIAPDFYTRLRSGPLAP